MTVLSPKPEMKSKLMFLLYFALCLFSRTAISQVIQTEPWMGAEVELTARQMLHFSRHVDFSYLEYLKKEDAIEFVIATRNSEKGLSFKFKETLEFEKVFQDLAISMPDFFELIPAELKYELTVGLDDLAQESKPVIAGANEKLEVKEKKMEATGIVLPNMPKSVIANSGLDLTRSQLKIPKMTQQESMAYYWKTVNQRWNLLPLERKLSALQWKKLPASSQAQLLVTLYAISAAPEPGHKNFVRDPLRLILRDFHAADIADEFYLQPDGSGVVEFHTLKPQGINSFLVHLKKLLAYVHEEKPVMYPGTRLRNPISLHVHISSPKWENQNIERLTHALKGIVIFEGLRRGDLGAMNQGSYSTSHLTSRDVVRLIKTKNAPDRIEVRYFYEDVEKELKFYDRLAKQSVSTSEKWARARFEQIMTPKLARLAIQTNPLMAVDLIGFEFLQKLFPTDSEMKGLLQDIFEKLSGEESRLREQYKKSHPNQKVDLDLTRDLINSWTYLALVGNENTKKIADKYLSTYLNTYHDEAKTCRSATAR